MKMVGDRREIAGRKKESASAQGARCIRYEGSNVVGGVRIRRVSRGKDYFFFFFLIDLLRPFSSTVAVSPGSFVPSVSSLLSLFRRFALSPLRYGVSVFARTYAKCIVDACVHEAKRVYRCMSRERARVGRRSSLRRILIGGKTRSSQLFVEIQIYLSNFVRYFFPFFPYSPLSFSSPSFHYPFASRREHRSGIIFRFHFFSFSSFLSFFPR